MDRPISLDMHASVVAMLERGRSCQLVAWHLGIGNSTAIRLMLLRRSTLQVGPSDSSKLVRFQAFIGGLLGCRSSAYQDLEIAPKRQATIARFPMLTRNGIV